MPSKIRNQDAPPSKLKIVLTTLILLLFFAGLAWPLAKKIKTSLSANKEFRSMEAELERLDQEASDLKKLISYFETNEYAETQARLKLNYRKPEEKVAVVYDQASVNETTPLGGSFQLALAQEADASALSNPARWRRYFFKNYQ